MLSSKVRTLVLSTSVLTGVFALSLLTTAQTQANKPIARYTATTASVETPGQTVRIDLFAWSSDADREQLATAWTNPPMAPAAPIPTAGNRGGRGRGRGAAPAGDNADAAVPAAAADAVPVANPDGAQAAGARGGRGARGARGGGGIPAAVVNAPPPVPLTPARSLSQSLQKAPTVGMIWTPESAGYSIRYAYHQKQPDGSERIILATDRRLSPWNSLWKPTSGTTSDTDYEFSIIELHIGAQGLGEGKASLASKVDIDAGIKSVALDNYAALPVVLKAVKRQTVK